jgi:hypothetical protein
MAEQGGPTSRGREMQRLLAAQSRGGLSLGEFARRWGADHASRVLTGMAGEILRVVLFPPHSPKPPRDGGAQSRRVPAPTRSPCR